MTIISKATLGPGRGRIFIPSPYIRGVTFTLEITPPSECEPALQVRARVVESFSPFTIAAVMKVALEEVISPPGATMARFGLPTEAVLKVYDHRFALCARSSWNLKPFTPEHEAEYVAYANGPHAARTLDELFESKERDPNPKYRYLRNEHYVALTLASYFTSECNAYKQLSEMQGGQIPILYGTTRFLACGTSRNLDLTKPGILLQYVEGTSMEFMEPGQLELDLAARECLEIIELYGERGVLNFNVSPKNFIVKPDGSGVVMIDFAQSRVRDEKMTDIDWKKEKWTYDEEGGFGHNVASGWGWNFEHSYRWRVEDSEAFATD